MNASELSEEMKACVALCLDCHRVCTEAVGITMQGSSEHADGSHLVTLLDCAQICLTHADFMARRSSYHAELAKICADICGECAASCDAHSNSDEGLRHCAQACRKCEESCRRMASESHPRLDDTSAPQGTGAIATPTAASGGGDRPVEGTGAGVTQFT